MSNLRTKHYFIKRAAHYVADGQTVFVFYVEHHRDWQVLKFEAGNPERKRLLSLAAPRDWLEVVWQEGSADDALSLKLSFADGGSFSEA